MLKAATVGLLAVALGLGPTALATPAPSVNGSGAERASGLWVFKPDGDEGVRPFVFAEVYRPLDQSQGLGLAVVGQGACFLLAAGTADAQETCRGYGIGHRLAAGEFELSPVLESAVLDFTDKLEHHRITWQATRPPDVVPLYAVGPGGGAVSATVAREAESEGDEYGMTLAQAATKHATLFRIGGVGANIDGADLSRAEDGTYRFTLRRPAQMPG